MVFTYDKHLNNKFSLSAFETKPLDTMGAGDSVLGIADVIMS